MWPSRVRSILEALVRVMAHVKSAMCRASYVGWCFIVDSGHLVESQVASLMCGLEMGPLLHS